MQTQHTWRQATKNYVYNITVLHHLNCSREWAFFGFHSTSDIQFFWRWNISPSSLLAERKLSTKRQDTLLALHFDTEGRHVWFSTVHVTWWNRDWPAENWCVVTWRDMWGTFIFNLCSFLLRTLCPFWFRSRLDELCPSQVIDSSS